MDNISHRPTKIRNQITTKMYLYFIWYALRVIVYFNIIQAWLGDNIYWRIKMIPNQLNRCY